MKTMSSLTEKWWYRLIKIAYILLFLTILVLANFLYVADVGMRQVDQEKTKILCNVGDDKIFSLDDIGLTIRAKYFGPDGTFNYEKYFSPNYTSVKTIVDECLGSSIGPALDVYRFQRIREMFVESGSPEGFEFSEQQKDELARLKNESFSWEREKYLNYNSHIFDIEPEINFLKGLSILLIMNLGIIFAAELIRRMFYYVALGKIFPKREK